MTPARLDILTSALDIIARLIMAARSDRDAAAIVHQLRAMGPSQRSDVDSIEAARLAEARAEGWGPPLDVVLDPATQRWGTPPDEAARAARADEPTVSQRVGGPLGEGD